MLALMGAALLSLLVVGSAALTGQPLLIPVGVALAAAILLVTRRGRKPSVPTGRR